MKYRVCNIYLFTVLTCFFFSVQSFAAGTADIAKFTVYSDSVVIDVLPGEFDNVTFAISGPSDYYKRGRIFENNTITLDLPLSKDGRVQDGKYNYQITAMAVTADNSPEKAINKGSRLNRGDTLRSSFLKQKGYFTIEYGELTESQEL